MNLKIKRLTDTARLPTRGSEHAAGLDLYADETTHIGVMGDWKAIRTGIAIAIPQGHVGLIWPRSGLAVQSGIAVLAGVIDSDFRGELKVVLLNNSMGDFEIKQGDRIAQLLIQPITMLDPIEAELDDTDRGHGGFGSTGV